MILVGPNKRGINVTNLALAIDTLEKACYRGAKLSLWEIRQGDSFDHDVLKSMAEDYQSMIDETITNQGTIEVLYIGDLKPKKYDLKTHFFHLNESAPSDAVHKIIIEAMSRGESKATLVNLRNVRSIEIDTGNSEVSGLTKALQTVKRAVDLLTLWYTSGTTVKSVDG